LCQGNEYFDGPSDVLHGTQYTSLGTLVISHSTLCTHHCVIFVPHCSILTALVGYWYYFVT